jgi:hypothetical protein
MLSTLPPKGLSGTALAARFPREKRRVPTPVASAVPLKVDGIERALSAKMT